MIYDAEWRKQFHQYVLQRLSVAHPDLTRIAAYLRDSAGVDIWTETPSDSSQRDVNKQHYSLEGWRAHYGAEFQALNQWRQQNGTRLQGYDPQALTALDGYLASIPAIGTAFNQVLQNYKDGQGRVIRATLSQEDRNTLATAIEAQLQ